MPLIEEHGAVSEPVARAMALGARESSGADWACATTGIAGPDGGTAEKPVGLTYVAAAGPGEKIAVEKFVFPGDRGGIKSRAAVAALDLLRRLML